MGGKVIESEHLLSWVILSLIIQELCQFPSAHQAGDISEMCIKFKLLECLQIKYVSQTSLMHELYRTAAVRGSDCYSTLLSRTFFLHWFGLAQSCSGMWIAWRGLLTDLRIIRTTSGWPLRKPLNRLSVRKSVKTAWPHSTFMLLTVMGSHKRAFCMLSQITRLTHAASANMFIPPCHPN